MKSADDFITDIADHEHGQQVVILTFFVAIIEWASYNVIIVM